MTMYPSPPPHIALGVSSSVTKSALAAVSHTTSKTSSTITPSTSTKRSGPGGNIGGSGDDGPTSVGFLASEIGDEGPTTVAPTVPTTSTTPRITRSTTTAISLASLPSDGGSAGLGSNVGQAKFPGGPQTFSGVITVGSVQSQNTGTTSFGKNSPLPSGGIPSTLVQTASTTEYSIVETLSAGGPVPTTLSISAESPEQTSTSSVFQSSNEHHHSLTPLGIAAISILVALCLPVAFLIIVRMRRKASQRTDHIEAEAPPPAEEVVTGPPPREYEESALVFTSQRSAMDSNYTFATGSTRSTLSPFVDSNSDVSHLGLSPPMIELDGRPRPTLLVDNSRYRRSNMPVFDVSATSDGSRPSMTTHGGEVTRNPPLSPSSSNTPPTEPQSPTSYRSLSAPLMAHGVPLTPRSRTRSPRPIPPIPPLPKSPPPIPGIHSNPFVDRNPFDDPAN